MKTSRILQTILLLAMLAVPAVMADTAKQLIPQVLKYTPAPAEPGNYMDIWMTISNRREDIQDLSISVVPKYPFIPAEDEPEAVFLPSLPALKDALVKFRVFVDLDARNEDYNLTFKYTWGGQRGEAQYDYPVTVEATDASVTVDHYEVTPQPLRPGSNATLILDLKNNGRIAVKDVDIDLQLDGTSLSTYGTGTYRRIPYINPGQEQELTYQLISDAKAETNVHTFPVGMIYKDERNNKYNSTSRVSLVVNAQPSLMAVVEESALKSGNDTADVTFKIVNSGAVDVKFLTMTLLPSDGYDAPVASTKTYLGNLDTDDFETATFKIKAKSDSPLFSVKLDYSDPFNNPYNQTFDVPVRIVRPAELGITPSYTLYYVLGAVLLAIILAYAWRRHHSKR